tara:strand:- start:182 stop:577 length:396 start_codon:yes stop_codon:yes gene_type:complete
MTESKNLKLANQKYYKYLVDCIVDGTEVTMQINSDREECIWFVFKFDDKGNHTAYRCGSYNKCTIFSVINATRRITNFLISYGLHPKEIITVLDLLKLRWIEKYDICFGDYIYGLPYEFTKYQLPFSYTKY